MRTNFIAIEKDGRIGLQQRDASQDSNISTLRKLSGETDMSTPPTKQEKSNIFADAVARIPAKTDILNQPIPESPRTDSADFTGSPRKNGESKSEASTSTPRRAKKPGVDDAPAKAAVVESGSATPKAEAGPVNGTGSGKGKEKASFKEEATRPATKPVAKTAPKPLAVPSASKSAARPAKSPTVSKAPRSPAATSTPKLPAKTPERAVKQPEKVETPRATAGPSNPSTSSSVKRPPALHASPASAGFVKPKVKSPTRPVKLPPSLTTHTAASGSKVNVPRQTVSRNSGSLQAADPLGRSPSRTSVSTVATTATRTAGTKTLKRQSSNVNRQRPSLGPPPKPVARDHPVTKKEKEVDESFLARMMRPTAASASKVQEKTPPRKPAAPATAKKAPSKAEGKTVRRIVPRIAKSTATAESSSASQVAEAGPSTTAEEPEPEPESIQHVEHVEHVESASDSGHESAIEEVIGVVEPVVDTEAEVKTTQDAEDEAMLTEATLKEEANEADEAHADQLTSEVNQLTLDEAAAETLVNGGDNHKKEVVETDNPPVGDVTTKGETDTRVKGEAS